ARPVPTPAPAGLFMIDVRLVLLWRYQTDIDHGRRGPGLPAAMIATVSPGRCAGNRYRESGQHYHLRYNTSVELKVARSCSVLAGSYRPMTRYSDAAVRSAAECVPKV